MISTKCLDWIVDLCKKLSGGHPVAQVFLIGLAFTSLMEGATGNGFPLVAPMMAQLGNTPLDSLVCCMMMNIVTSWCGGIGFPLWYGLDGIGLSAGEMRMIALKATGALGVVMHVVPIIGACQIVSFEAIQKNWLFVLLSIWCVYIPGFLITFVSFQFTVLAMGIFGIIGISLLAQFKIGLKDEEEIQHMQKEKAYKELEQTMLQFLKENKIQYDQNILGLLTEKVLESYPKLFKVEEYQPAAFNPHGPKDSVDKTNQVVLKGLQEVLEEQQGEGTLLGSIRTDIDASVTKKQSQMKEFQQQQQQSQQVAQFLRMYSQSIQVEHAQGVNTSTSNYRFQGTIEMQPPSSPPYIRTGTHPFAPPPYPQSPRSVGPDSPRRPPAFPQSPTHQSSLIRQSSQQSSISRQQSTQSQNMLGSRHSMQVPTVMQRQPSQQSAQQQQQVSQQPTSPQQTQQNQGKGPLGEGKEMGYDKVRDHSSTGSETSGDSETNILIPAKKTMIDFAKTQTSGGATSNFPNTAKKSFADLTNRIAPIEIKSKFAYMLECVSRTFPLWATVLLLVLARTPAIGIAQYLKAEHPNFEVQFGSFVKFFLSASVVINLEDILQVHGLNWEFQIFYVPFIIPFVVVTVITLLIFRKDMGHVKFYEPFENAVKRLEPVLVPLLSALVLVSMSREGEKLSPCYVIGSQMAAFFGKAFIIFAGPLGLMGTFFSGVCAISNRTFAAVQKSAAEVAGMNPQSIMVLQVLGASAGEIVSLHAIITGKTIMNLQHIPEGQIMARCARASLAFIIIATIASLPFFIT